MEAAAILESKLIDSVLPGESTQLTSPVWLKMQHKPEEISSSGFEFIEPIAREVNY